VRSGDRIGNGVSSTGASPWVRGVRALESGGNKLFGEMTVIRARNGDGAWQAAETYARIHSPANLNWNRFRLREAIWYRWVCSGS
jgi:hypothetical protein